MPGTAEGGDAARSNASGAPEPRLATPAGVEVWDPPTRLFHWSIALFVVISWISAENGAMDWHAISGVVVLGLLIFRIIWGVIGGSTARFAHFLRAPGAAAAYLRRPADAEMRPGHTPIGGYSVIAMLLALATQVATGLFAVDVDGLESGPLSYRVSFEQGRLAAQAHEASFNVVLSLVALHVLAITYYHLFRSRALTAPMVTGRDRQLQDTSEELRPAGRKSFLIAVLLSGVIAWWIWAGAPLA